METNKPNGTGGKGQPTPENPMPPTPEGKEAEKQPAAPETIPSPSSPQEPPKPETPQKKEEQPKAEKVEKQPKADPDKAKGTAKEEAPPSLAEPVPPPPKDATRPGEKETIVYINHADLHPFKDHPFQVRDDDAMKALVASVKERGVDQPALVRPREGGGYELVAGHRRQHASEQAGYANIPCVIRNLTDEEAILAMTESNFNQRAEILPSERALALKMQLDAIKRQGARDGGDVGKRSNEVIADRNGMTVKQVQRYIALNKLTPDMMKLVDDKGIPFTAAVEMSYIKPSNQQYIALTIEAQGSPPSLKQSQRLRELDQAKKLTHDVIDGIMLEEKKEEIKVIITSTELGKFFGPEKTPREMKDTILKLLEEHKAKNPQELGNSVKKKNIPEK